MGTYRGWGDAEVHGPHPPKGSSAHQSRGLIPWACFLEEISRRNGEQTRHISLMLRINVPLLRLSPLH